MSRSTTPPLLARIAASVLAIAAPPVAFSTVAPSGAEAQAAPCRFVLGFATIRDLVVAAVIARPRFSTRFAAPTDHAWRARRGPEAAAGCPAPRRAT